MEPNLISGALVRSCDKVCSKRYGDFEVVNLMLIWVDVASIRFELLIGHSKMAVPRRSDYYMAAMCGKVSEYEWRTRVVRELVFIVVVVVFFRLLFVCYPRAAFRSNFYPSINCLLKRCSTHGTAVMLGEGSSTTGVESRGLFTF